MVSFGNLAPDLSLIRDYTRKDSHASVPARVTHFQNRGKNLYYVQAQHEVGIDNPTCETIKKSFDKYSPQIAIIEGLDTSEGISPSSYFQYIPKDNNGKFENEQVYTAYLAHKKNIPFIGGEPDYGKVIKEIAKKGYSPQDAMAMHLLAMIPSIRMEAEKNGGGLSEKSFAENATYFLQNSPAFVEVPQEQRLSYDGFKAWYEKHKANNKKVLEIETADLDPYNTPNSSYFQKLFAAITRVREEHLDTTTANALNEHDKVLVVYGSGHLILSHSVFEKMFEGKGKTSQFIPGDTAQAQLDNFKSKKTTVKTPIDYIDRSPQALIARGRGNTTTISLNK